MAQWKTEKQREKWLDSLDSGIRHYVDVLEKEGTETCQSCQGGPDHSYLEPTVDFLGSSGTGFKVLGIAMIYGLPVSSLHQVWNVDKSGPFEMVWRLVFRIDAIEFLKRDKIHADNYFKNKKLGRPTH